MKLLSLLALLFTLACTQSEKNKNWDSGAASQKAFNEERAFETDETTGDQIPELVPATKPKTSK